MEHPILFLFESLIFWILVFILISSIVLFFRNYKKAYNYELQVNRGWEDMVFRTERLLTRIQELQEDISNLKKEQLKNLEKLETLNKIALKPENTEKVRLLPTENTKKRTRKTTNPES
jgi:hypothetical protein